MKDVRLFLAVSLATGLLFAAPRALQATEPERLPEKTFDVRIESGATPTVEVTFALAMSDVPSYPVAITAIGGAVEELLYDGMLSEGFYRLRAPITKIKSGPIKLVLRTRITHRTGQGPQNFARYITWDGSL